MENSNYIIAQIIGFVAFIISLVAYHKKEKEEIFGSMLISNILNLAHYLLLGAFSGGMTKLIAILRDLTFINKKDKKVLNSNLSFIIFIMLYILAAIFTYENIFSLFPIIAALIYTMYSWNGDGLKVKKTAVFCYVLWIGYNIFVFSIVGILSNVVSLISTCIAIKNENKRKKFKM